MNRFVVALASLSLALFACRGDDGGGNNADDVPGDDQPNPDGHVAGTVTVKQVQDDAMASGTQIELKGVVVIAVDKFGAKTGDLYVEDADGGAFSGVKVFGAPLDAVSTLVPGDIVDITNAQKNEFACAASFCGFDFPAGQSVTEVESVNGGDLSVVKTGSGALPAPATVDALAIDNMADQAARDAEWEKWEGVYIKVINARQLTPDDTFGDDADDQHSFDITGHAEVESVLSKFSAEAVTDVCFAGIVGIGDYFGNYLVLPTAESSTVGGGTACKALPVYVPATATELQTGVKTGAVTLTDVIVIARDEVGGQRGLWVADSATSAVNNGVFVFTFANTPDAAFTVGSKVNVKGTATEFGNGTLKLTELTNATITAGTAGTSTVTALNGTAVAAKDGTMGYEGTLVKLTNVKVTKNAGMTTGMLKFNQVELTDASGTILMDDDIDAYVPTTTPPTTTETVFPVNTCYASITGIVSTNTSDSIRTFNPRTAADFVTGGTCP